jgi:DNA-binding NarL/FixJ family response regulator
MIRLVQNTRVAPLSLAQSDRRARPDGARGPRPTIESPCSVVVADDHPLLLWGLVDVLRSCPTLKVVGACGHGNSALEAIRQLSPDVAVLDIAMPPNALDILATIGRESRATKVVYLTASITDSQVLTAIGHGVKAILFKDTAADDLVSCVRTVADGGKWFPAGLLEAALERETGRRGLREETDRMLTTREREIALLVAEGLSNKQVGERLNIAEGTVKIHLNNIYRKCGMQNRTLLAAFARAHVKAGTPLA